MKNRPDYPPAVSSDIHRHQPQINPSESPASNAHALVNGARAARQGEAKAVAALAGQRVPPYA